jgi:HAD superfamily phosphatase (TIGR01668 family)
MFDKFVPDIYTKSIYTINYKQLKKNNVKCLIFDLNNTIAPLTLKRPNKKIIDLFEELKDMKFKIYIVSNSNKSRVEPFKDILGIDSAYMSFKPCLKKYKKIFNMNKFKDNEIACIGDEILTDMKYGNYIEGVGFEKNTISYHVYNKLKKYSDLSK